MVVQMIAVAVRRQELVFHLRTNGVGAGSAARVLLEILLEEIFLDGFGERADGVAGLNFARVLGNRDAVSDGQDAFGADEAESGIFGAAVDEIHAQGEIEGGMAGGLRIIVEAEQDVGNVAAVFPESQAAGGVDARGSDGSHDEVHSGKQMDEQVAGDAGAIVAIAAPAEQALRFERDFGRAAEEAVPVNVFGRGVGRDGIFPRADGVVAIPPGFHHVGLADGAGLHEILGFFVNDGTDALAADLQDSPGFLFGFDERLAVFDALHHGLFEVHVFAGVHGVDGDFLVPVIGRARR